jgi:hypothetical protein
MYNLVQAKTNNFTNKLFCYFFMARVSGFSRVARWNILKTKNLNLGKFWTALEWKMLLYFMVIWNILRPFGIFYGHLLMLW